MTRRKRRQTEDPPSADQAKDQEGKGAGDFHFDLTTVGLSRWFFMVGEYKRALTTRARHGLEPIWNAATPADRTFDVSAFREAAQAYSSKGETSASALSSADPLVQASVAAVAERVPEIVHARQEALSQQTIDLLVDAYLKSAPTAAARHEIEMDNARERARFVEEFPCYTSRELAELAGHEAANASATAARWKKARRIIGLPWKGSDLFPAFQFDEGRPRPIVGRVIEALPERMSPWQTAFWLTSGNGWLGGATPLERLDSGDEAAVIAAAVREGEAFEG